MWFHSHTLRLLSLAKFDNLEANSALIGTLNANIIKTGNRDIGYHIPLKELGQKGELNEGDVVGFFEDENQKSAIERLNKENYSRAKLAGVITRSYYVEGLCPEALLGMSLLLSLSLSPPPLSLSLSPSLFSTHSLSPSPYLHISHSSLFLSFPFPLITSYLS